jgi:hypothetical protein
MLLVSSFFPDVTRHIHSLRASGVISFHMAFAFGTELMASRKSAGILCTAPFPDDLDFIFFIYCLNEENYLRVLGWKRLRSFDA